LISQGTSFALSVEHYSWVPWVGEQCSKYVVAREHCSRGCRVLGASCYYCTDKLDTLGTELGKENIAYFC